MKTPTTPRRQSTRPFNSQPHKEHRLKHHAKRKQRGEHLFWQGAHAFQGGRTQEAFELFKRVDNGYFTVQPDQWLNFAFELVGPEQRPDQQKFIKEAVRYSSIGDTVHFAQQVFGHYQGTGEINSLTMAVRIGLEGLKKEGGPQAMEPILDKYATSSIGEGVSGNEVLEGIYRPLIESIEKQGSCPARSVINALDSVAYEGPNGELEVDIAVNQWQELVSKARDLRNTPGITPEVQIDLNTHCELYEKTIVIGNI